MGDSGDKQTLTNADFRKILFTPRPGTKPDLAQQAKEQRKEQNLQNKAKPRPKPKQQAGKGNKAEASDEEDGPGYRDRAAERRKGLGIEHIVDDDDAAAFPVAAAPNVGHLTYEETKYLGGDVDHTHLVKGLDYALLSKIRSEQMQQGGKSGGGDADGAPQPVSFSGPLGRAVYNILIKSQQHQADIVHEDISERFLPRRTAFVFNIDEAGMKDIFQVPTTLLRAKEDCPAPPKIAEASSDAVVLDRLSKIMAYMAMGSGNSGGSSKTKLKKERKQELLLEAGFIQPMLSKKKSVVENEEKEAELDTKLQVNKPVDEEEDIFADAGTDYVAERRIKKPTDEAGEIKLQKEAATADEATKKRGKYFGSDAPTSLEGADLPPIAKAMPGSGVDQAEEERKAKAREARHREMLASVGAADDDGYAECYPSYYDAAGAVYDSEDDDGTGMAKAKTVDEVEEGDGGDGGKGGKDKGMAARKEAARLSMKEKQKEEAELNKLQKVFEEKGYGNAGAFGAKDGDKGGAAGEAPPGTVPPMPTAKRRRI